MGLHRRQFNLAALAAAAAASTGCRPQDPYAHITGGFAGTHPERGHLLRGDAFPAPSETRRTRVLIAGGGVAGLAAARALRLRGVDDFALLELEDAAGGNSRSASLGGMACPLGAHYLPLPPDSAGEVQDFLEEQGLRRRVAGRWQYDERHLCHSPQERLFFQGAWQQGLLPVDGVGVQTLAQYQSFAKLVGQAQKAARYAIPSTKAPFASAQRSLDAITFEAWLNQNALTDPHLRWFLDYCCRDDYGAGTATVSAWAGLHYFASRHGFHAPSSDGSNAPPGEAVLTWPEGNAWLTQRLLQPLGERVHTGWVVTRIAHTRHGVEVDAYAPAQQRSLRWVAERCVVALPIFVAARVVQDPPELLREAARRVQYAPWLVANLLLSNPLRDRPGAPPSWDNVVYGAQSLGYVDARHQTLSPLPGPTVLTSYRALALSQRQDLLSQPYTHWRDAVLADLAAPHPDLAAKTQRIAITRYGHAMAVPVPGFKSHFLNVLPRMPAPTGAVVLSKSERLLFAHADWAGYSVFEEAFTLGHAAGSAAA